MAEAEALEALAAVAVLEKAATNWATLAQGPEPLTEALAVALAEELGTGGGDELTMTVDMGVVVVGGAVGEGVTTIVVGGWYVEL